MDKKVIPNSPGYFITSAGKIYNKKNKLMKTWFSKDGYERIRLISLKHNKRVNRTVHLLVAEIFLNGGKYLNSDLEVNHIDGVKTNNDISNLELITPTENVNHAHDNQLYTFDIQITLVDNLTKTAKKFRSLREICRYLNVSLNYIRPRIIISNHYLIQNRYKFNIDYENYLNHISTIKNEKTIYVYSHITKKYYTLTSYVQISILFGLSYINIGKKLLKYPGIKYYTGGYTFSLEKLEKIDKPVEKEIALNDREFIWKKLAMNVV